MVPWDGRDRKLSGKDEGEVSGDVSIDLKRDRTKAEMTVTRISLHWNVAI